MRKIIIAGIFVVLGSVGAYTIAIQHNELILLRSQLVHQEEKARQAESRRAEAEKLASQATAEADQTLMKLSELAVSEASKEEGIKRERRQVLSDPDRYLDATDVRTYDEGWIEDYRRVEYFSLLNKSSFYLRDIEGRADWMDSRGKLLGSTSFRIKGHISPGESKSFGGSSGTLISSTLKSNARQVKLHFISVRIVDVSPSVNQEQ